MTWATAAAELPNLSPPTVKHATLQHWYKPQHLSTLFKACPTSAKVYTLNSRYEYVGFKPSHMVIPDHILACKCEDYVSFLSAFNYMKIRLLFLLAKSHGLPESARRSALTAGFRDHKCATTCHGNDNLLYFKSLARPRTNIIQSPHTPTADIPTAVFNNAPADSNDQSFTTFELNPNYDLVDVGDLHSINDMYSRSAEHTICYCPSLAQFLIHYLSLSTAQLLTLSRHHRIQVQEESNKLFPIQQLSRHDCASHCSSTYLVFIKRLYPCTTPFVPHNITPVALPTQALTLTEMADLNTLPVIFNNEIQVDVDDGITHASTYLLNSSFDFVEVVSPVTLITLHHADIGVKFTAVAPHCIASLVSMYDHFTLSQLIDIAKHHRVPVSRRKPEQTISVLSHHCSPDVSEKAWLRRNPSDGASIGGGMEVKSDGHEGSQRRPKTVRRKSIQ
ncbi:hypothetical protein C8R44DRAFT_746229 [Mycena epipterygia]|nr:hypothetical protein C8R44DRAFT_746229 [Mycena epipterygia]